MYQETEGQTIVRRAKEALAACKLKEDELRRALADASESTKRAREKYEAAFLEEEKREADRRRNAG